MRDRAWKRECRTPGEMDYYFFMIFYVCVKYLVFFIVSLDVNRRDRWGEFEYTTVTPVQRMRFHPSVPKVSNCQNHLQS